MVFAPGSADPSTPGPGRATARRWRPPPLVAGSALLHAAALPVLAAVPGWRLAAAALLVADHAVLTGAGLWPTSRWLGPNLSRLPVRPDGGRPAIALTFDDGPDPEVTPRVLDLLDRHGARATFFCVGKRVERHSALAAEIAHRGHRVENHSHRHLARFSLLLPGAIAREVDRAQRAIREATGREPLLFRPPAGFRSGLLEPILARRGLSLVSWTRRAFDTVRRNPARIVRTLGKGIEPGAILVLHDGGTARTPAGRPVVLEALPPLLARLVGDGFDLVPVEPPSPARQ